MAYFFFLYWSPFSSLCMIFVSISSNIDKVFWIKLQILTSIIRTGKPIDVELIDLVNSAIIFPSKMTLLRWLISLLGSLWLSVLQFWTCFFLLMLFYFRVAFPPLGNSDHVVVSVSINFPTNSKWDILFPLLIEMVFEIIWEMFYGRISLNSVLLLLLINFVSSGWNWCIYPSS